MYGIEYKANEFPYQAMRKEKHAYRLKTQTLDVGIPIG